MARKILRAAEVSAMTGISEGTLRWWRHLGDRGPKSFVLGPKRVAYLESDVEERIEEQYQAAQRETAR